MRWKIYWARDPRTERWRQVGTTRINSDNIWVVKHLLSGNPDRIRVALGRYLVNFGTQTQPVFAVRLRGELHNRKPAAASRKKTAGKKKAGKKKIGKKRAPR